PHAPQAEPAPQAPLRRSGYRVAPVRGEGPRSSEGPTRPPRLRRLRPGARRRFRAWAPRRASHQRQDRGRAAWVRRGHGTGELEQLRLQPADKIRGRGLLQPEPNRGRAVAAREGSAVRRAARADGTAAALQRAVGDRWQAGRHGADGRRRVLAADAEHERRRHHRLRRCVLCVEQRRRLPAPPRAARGARRQHRRRGDDPAPVQRSTGHRAGVRDDRQDRDLMERWQDYLTAVSSGLRDLAITDGTGTTLTPEGGFQRWVEITREVHAHGRNVYVIGNGASAAMASHMAADACKNGGLRAQAFNDASLLTATGNDLAFEQVFAVPLGRFGRAGDLLITV